MKSFLLFCSIAITAAQVKIGYINVEQVLFLMPEYKEVESQLFTFEQKLSEQLKIKQQYLQTKLEEYQQLRSEGKLSVEQDQQMQQELLKLQKEIQDFAQQAEMRLLEKRQELMQPLIDKLQKAIDELAEELGYDYILNTSISGTSVVIRGPEEHNLTIPLLKKLNIEIPKELQQQESLQSEQK